MRLYRADNGYWYFDAHIRGRRVRKSLRTKNRALAKQRFQKQLTDNPALGDGAAADIPVVKFFDQYVEHYRHIWKYKSWRGDRGRLDRVREFLVSLGLTMLCDVDKATAQALTNWLWRQWPTLSTASINRYVSLLKTMLKFAVDSGLLERSPLLGLPKLKENRRRRRLLTWEETAKLIAAAPGLFSAFIEMVLLTGARLDEMRTLKTENVNLKLREITFENVKTGGDLTIPINDRGVEILSTLLDLDRKYIFSRKGSNQPAWKDHKVSHVFRKLATQLGIDATVHDLRSTFVSRLLDAGVGLKTVQGLIGDKTAHMVLAVYAQMVPGSARRAIEELKG